jgi:hypothetical protein
VRVKPLGAVGAVIFFVCFVLLPAAPTHAEWPSIWPSIQPPHAPSSGIAQKFLNGLRNLGAHNHRTVSSPPLPRPRPPELPRESVELNKAAPEVAPASEAPIPVEASEAHEGGPAPMSNQRPDASRTPAESAAINSAKPPAEVTAPVETNEPPAAELAPVSGSNKATPEPPPAVSTKPDEAVAPVPIND